MLAGEDRTVLAVARDEDARVRVLHTARPHGDVAEAVVTTFPSERFGLGEAGLHEQGAFLVTLARLPRVRAVGEVLVRRASQHRDPESSVEEVVEHRVLLGDPHRVVQRQVGAHHADLCFLVPLSGERGEEHRVGCQLLRRVVVLGEVQRVETGVERGAALVERVLVRQLRPLAVARTRRCRPRLDVDRSVVVHRLEELDLHAAPRPGPSTWPLDTVRTRLYTTVHRTGSDKSVDYRHRATAKNVTHGGPTSCRRSAPCTRTT